jgi:hypothetical protein
MNDHGQKLTEKPVPPFAVHDQSSIKGFFGPYRFLSNFYAAEVWCEGLSYPSVEHAYQAMKFPPQLRSPFREASMTPGEAKRRGAEALIDRAAWLKERHDLMVGLVFSKFHRHRSLRERLLATGCQYLEETNAWGDVYWGVCAGQGENHLGKILMALRGLWAEVNQHLTTV